MLNKYTWGGVFWTNQILLWAGLESVIDVRTTIKMFGFFFIYFRQWHKSTRQTKCLLSHTVQKETKTPHKKQNIVFVSSFCFFPFPFSFPLIYFPFLLSIFSLFLFFLPFFVFLLTIELCLLLVHVKHWMNAILATS